MATNMTRFGEGKILQALFKQVAIGVAQNQWHVGLMKNQSGVSGVPTIFQVEEVAVANHPSYARLPLGAVTYVASANAATPARIENDVELLWPEALTAWGNITAIGIFDALTGGNLYTVLVSELANQRDIRAGDRMFISIDGLKVTGAV